MTCLVTVKQLKFKEESSRIFFDGLSSIILYFWLLIDLKFSSENEPKFWLKITCEFCAIREGVTLFAGALLCFFASETTSGFSWGTRFPGLTLKKYLLSGHFRENFFENKANLLGVMSLINFKIYLKTVKEKAVFYKEMTLAPVESSEEAKLASKKALSKHSNPRLF
ncbi:hypothetical protein BpHYR1_014349 [Brachionus plicatilis]|uniref:Uncharacterized protein n=1 Tax=Brachionus plicatilis TaxID=10195 RepID=A0A3M7SV10_BRAPC|nr:hypothetical protein BpHYR1_014349 [Brachionus plicatilis]